LALTHFWALRQGDRGEMDYWLGVLSAQIPTVVEKAMASEGATSGADPSLALRAAMLWLGACIKIYVRAAAMHVAVLPVCVRREPGTRSQQAQTIRAAAPDLPTILSGSGSVLHRPAACA